MHVLGHDFHWGKAERNFGAYDKLINFINERKNSYNVEVKTKYDLSIHKI
jgi:hypothetical protein